MLENACLLAKIGADTAESERKFAKNKATTLRVHYPTVRAAWPTDHVVECSVDSWRVVRLAFRGPLAFEAPTLHHHSKFHKDPVRFFARLLCNYFKRKLFAI